MKKQLLFIHGGEAFASDEHWMNFLRDYQVDPFEVKGKKWRDGLQEKLGDDWEVFIPLMPCAINAKYEEWKIWFEKYIPFLRDDVVLMGHSLGAMFLARYLSENTMPITVSKLFLLAGAFEPDPEIDGDGRAEFFYTHLDNFEKLGQSAGEIHIMHSTDDFVVPYHHAEKFAQHLPDATLHTFKDRNHFLQEEFPELVELLEK